MSAWTPGPWEWGEVHHSDEFGDPFYVGLEPAVVAAFDFGGCSHGTPGLAVESANARLIAAAPEMAELLAEIAGGGEYPTDGFPSSLELYGERMASDVLDDIRALLARIKGEA